MKTKELVKPEQIDYSKLDYSKYENKCVRIVCCSTQYEGKISEFRDKKVDLYLADGSKKTLSVYFFKLIEEIPDMKIVIPKKKGKNKKIKEYEKAAEEDEIKEKEKAMNEDIDDDKEDDNLEGKVSGEE